MCRMITIRCENNGVEKAYPFGTDLADIIKDQKIKLKNKIVGAMVNNEVEELTYKIFKPKTVKFIDISHKDGMRMYVRSLIFVLMKAINELYPKADLSIEHSISNGYFCEIKNDALELNLQTVSDIENRMRKIIDKDHPFQRKEVLNTEAIKIFEKNNFNEKARLFQQSPSLYTSIYILNGLEDYFYGYLIPSTGYIKHFDLIKIYNGMLLRIPSRENPTKLRSISEQNKLFEVLQEHKEWVNILDAANVGRVNEQVISGHEGELIKIAEALHEKKISQIAEKIKADGNKKLVLISGPSSSGKTTFSKRLSIQLKVAGLKPFLVSIDNYFVNREATPLDENGEYDYEALEAIDIELFNRNINDLKAGKVVKMPKFDFEKGKKVYNGEKFKITEDTVIIAEGIHALNPKLTQNINNELKYKIYISALTQICIDSHNRIPTTDNRLIRRIVRDNKYRNYSAEETLARWGSVQRGEKKNIFPYQEEADIMFNSALLYELGVLKKYAEPLLEEIWQNKEEYAEAQRLLKFLSYFKDTKEDEIPPTSILREFFGQSSFRY